MTAGELSERLERQYPPGSFGAKIVELHRDITRVAGRELADRAAMKCFGRVDEARDKGLREFFRS